MPVALCFVVFITQIAAAQSSRGKPPAADEGAWHRVEVTGGRAALDALGVPARVDRGMVMTQLIRRLHFAVSTPLELETAVLTLSTATTDLATLQNAIALGSTAAKPLTLAGASDKKVRRSLEQALEAMGLELKESKRQYRIETDNGDSKVALRARLAQVGVNVEAIKQALMRGDPLIVEAPSIALPLPLSPQTWSSVVFEREVPRRRLFVEILNDPAARLLYHGLVGLDAETRRWMGGQPQLLRRLYRDQEAIRSFSLFGPALKIAGGRVVVPGGAKAEQRWAAALDVDLTKPDRFVRRLFDHDGGRTAGLYFTVAGVDAARQAFLLSTADSIRDGNDRFKRLVSSFANCYPGNATQYPFGLRSYDSALLLLELGISEIGVPAGPLWRRFWSRTLEGDNLPDSPANELRDLADDGTVDAAWMVDRLCDSATINRGATFVTLLAGNRTFAGVTDAELPDTLVALRMRRLYPSLFITLEKTGLRRPRTYAALARHAAALAALDDPARGVTALQQFQGTVALTANAITAHTLSLAQGEALLESLAAVRFESERYDGRLADWLVKEWLPAVRAQAASPPGAAPTAEQSVASALAGRVDSAAAPLRWEGQDYVVDYADMVRRRLDGVRKKQGGLPLDSVLELRRLSLALQASAITLDEVKALRSSLSVLAPKLKLETTATELATDGPNVEDKLRDVINDLGRIDEPRDIRRAAEAGTDLERSIDFLLGHVLAAWAYAPHVGDADSPALTGGDGSLRHEFGLRKAGSDKHQQRWELPLFGGDSGSIAGSLLGVEAALSQYALRRLSIDALPPPPAIGGNDLMSLMLTAALSNPRRLTEADMAGIAAAVAAGTAAVTQALANPAQLDALAQKGAMSPWRRESLSWTAVEEHDRLADQFSLTEVARIGGLRPEGLAPWGTASMVTGCLCLRMPQTRIPELIIGRAADGLLGGHSADLTIRIATLLAELKMPASLTTPVLAYAVREFLDQVQPQHVADFDAFARQARALDRRTVEDILGALAAVGPLRAAGGQ
jgi:hypothetical protein